MPPFRYDPYQSPFVGSISQLLGAQGDIRAQQAVNVGNAQAQAALVSGNAWAQAGTGLGLMAGNTLQQFADPRRKLYDLELKRQQDRLSGEAKLNSLMQADQLPAGDVGPRKPSYLDADGLWDLPALNQELGRLGLGAQAADLLKGPEMMNDSIVKHQTFAKQMADSLILMTGDMANDVLKLHKVGVPILEGMDFVARPSLATKTIDQRAYQQVRAQIEQLPPDQQEAALTALVDRAARLDKTEAVGKDTIRTDRYGRTTVSNLVPDKQPDYTIEGQRFDGQTHQPIGPRLYAPTTPKALQSENEWQVRGADGVWKSTPVIFDPEKGGRYLSQADYEAKKPIDPATMRKIPTASATGDLGDDKMIDEAAHNMLANPRDLTSIKTITSLRGDQRLKLYNRLKELDPSFNSGNIDRQIKFLDSYENPAGKPAINRQSMNNIILHSADLSDINQDYRRLNVKIANMPLNLIRAQYSDDYERYSTTVAVLRDEIALYFAAGYAPTKDQGETWQKVLNEDITPNMLEAFAKQIIHVGLRRASTHNSDFKAMMGFDDPNLITPDAVQAAGRLGLGDAVRPFGSGGRLGDQPRPSANTLVPNTTQVVEQGGVQYRVTTDAKGKVIKTEVVR